MDISWGCSDPQGDSGGVQSEEAWGGWDCHQGGEGVALVWGSGKEVGGSLGTGDTAEPPRRPCSRSGPWPVGGTGGDGACCRAV